MKTVKLFWKQRCPNCPPAKQVVEKLRENGGDFKIMDYDVETVEGMAEASFHEVMATPSIIVVDGDDNELASFRGRAPTLAELESALR